MTEVNQAASYNSDLNSEEGAAVCEWGCIEGYIPDPNQPGVCVPNCAFTTEELILDISSGSEHQITAPEGTGSIDCLLYTSPSPRDLSTSRMPSSA